MFVYITSNFQPRNSELVDSQPANPDNRPTVLTRETGTADNRIVPNKAEANRRLSINLVP